MHSENWLTFRSEEGARFPKMAVSSGVWADVIPLETAWDLREVLAANPKSMKEELDRIGYCGDQPASYRSNPFAAHFELHIEQGPILEDEGLKIGVVHGKESPLTEVVRLLTAANRRPSIQVVQHHRQRPRQPRRHNTTIRSQRSRLMRQQNARRRQYSRQKIRRSRNNRYFHHRPWNRQHNGAYRQIHPRPSSRQG